MRRWLSSSIVNKCRGVSYDKLVAAGKRLLPANSEVMAVIEKGKVGGCMDVEEEADNLASCPSGLPHALAVPALEAWMASLAINSVLHVDAAAAFAMSANLIAAVGKSAATSSSTYTPPVLSPLIARLYRFRGEFAASRRARAKRALGSWLLGYMDIDTDVLSPRLLSPSLAPTLAQLWPPRRAIQSPKCSPSSFTPCASQP